MQHVYEGKTKTVYKLDNGNYFLLFKDDATGENGVFDPGSNTVGLKIEGMGVSGLKITEYFYSLLEKRGIKTHFIKTDFSKPGMEVKPAVKFGNGLEAICRFKSTGSFMRRYGSYAKEGQDLDGFVEITLKDDDRGDPVISGDALDILGIMDKNTYQNVKEMTKQIAVIVKEELAKKNLELYDIKFEFGKNNDEILLIDEISGGNMRVYKNGKKLEPLEIEKLILQ